MQINYIEQFETVYKQAFDENGNVRTCGRQACRELITICGKIDRSGTNYGSMETGVMNVEAIQSLKEQYLSASKPPVVAVTGSGMSWHEKLKTMREASQATKRNDK